MIDLFDTVATEEEVYTFLRRHYKHERFEGRNGPAWGKDYSQRVAYSAMARLVLYGRDVISRHESATGRAIRFDSQLNIIGQG